MPVYSVECSQCQREDEYFSSIAEMDANLPQCCGKPMQRVIGACMGFVRGDVHYISPATGREITSHAARREDFKRSRTRPWEGLATERQEADRKRAYTEQKQDAKLTEAAHRAWHQLPPAKRAALDGSE